MVNKRYPPEMEDFVRELASKGTSNAEIRRLCEERFKLGPISAIAMASYKTDRGIVNPDKYPPEVVEFIREKVKEVTLKELLPLIKEKFGRTYTREALKGFMERHDIRTGRTGRFEIGSVPATKGKPMPDYVRAKVCGSWFKKGDTPANTQPVGSEILDRDGFIRVKVTADLNVPRWRRWRYKHHLLWEKYHGPVPRNMVVTFLDGDKTNITIENLELISRAELAYLNSKELRSESAEVTKSSIRLARLRMKVRDLEAKNKKRNKDGH